jgi:hypothetical protein
VSGVAAHGAGEAGLLELLLHDVKIVMRTTSANVEIADEIAAGNVRFFTDGDMRKQS